QGAPARPGAPGIIGGDPALVFGLEEVLPRPNGIRPDYVAIDEEISHDPFRGLESAAEVARQRRRRLGEPQRAPAPPRRIEDLRINERLGHVVNLTTLGHRPARASTPEVDVDGDAAGLRLAINAGN